MLRRYAVIAIVLASFAASAQTIDRPVVKVGDECTYDVFDNLRNDNSGSPEKVAERRGVVKSVDGDLININWTQKILVSRDTQDLEEGTFIYDRDLNVVERNGRKFNPAFPGRFYPLVPGGERKGVKSSYPRQQLDGESTASLDGKASNWEKVTVPAGNFDVIPITWDGFYSTSRGIERWSGRIYQQLYYSPSTSCVVVGVYRQYRGSGAIWSDRTYKLTSSKNE